MFKKDNTFYAVDWQCASLGTGSIDYGRFID
jgi:hypothetical protein